MKRDNPYKVRPILTPRVKAMFGELWDLANMVDERPDMKAHEVRRTMVRVVDMIHAELVSRDGAR